MLILLTTSAMISLNTDDFLRIGGIVLMSVVYLSLFYLIGMLISAITRRTSTALILSMFVWAFLVLVYPNLVLTAVDTAPRMDTESAAYHQVKRIWEELERESRAVCPQRPCPISGRLGKLHLWDDIRRAITFSVSLHQICFKRP